MTRDLCDGVDNDCDGEPDEDCPDCLGTSVAAPGGRYTIPLGEHSETGSCGGAGSEGYLTLTVNELSDVFIATHNELGLDTILYARSGSCTGSELSCNDDAQGLLTSSLSLTQLAPGTYHVFVDTKAAISADVDVDVYITAAGVASDRCGQPTFIPAGTTRIVGNTCGLDADYEPAATGGCAFIGTGGGAEGVYYFVVDSSRIVTFDGCTAGSDFDQTFYIRSVCTDVSASAQETCNDDGCGGPLTCDRALRSSMSPTLSPGLYYLFADGFDDGGGVCPCGNFEIGTSGL